MQFRRTKPDEIDRIMDILADGRASLAALGIDQWQGSYPERNVIMSDVESGASHVVEDEGLLIATAMVGFGGESRYDLIDEGEWLTRSDSEDPRYAVVHRMAVASESRGRGAATFLLEQAEQLAREQGCESLRIETHPGNDPMHKLLERQEFTRCGIVRVDYVDGGIPERVAYEKIL